MFERKNIEFSDNIKTMVNNFDEINFNLNFVNNLNAAFSTPNNFTCT